MMLAPTFDIAHGRATEALGFGDAEYCFDLGVEYLHEVAAPDHPLDEAEALGIVQLGILLIETAALTLDHARNSLILLRDEIEYLRVGGVGPAPHTLASC